MADPETERLNEIDLEMEQRELLMELFSLVETFDRREAVITFCEAQVNSQRYE